MAENYEYESLLQQMLDMQPTDVDKREGSIIYNTCAACAFLISQQTYMLGYMMNLLFADTAEEEWLDRVCHDFGVDRKLATNAVRQINAFDSSSAALDVPIGSRFQIENVSFATTEKIATGQFKAQCEQAGTDGNLYCGSILPIDNINGLGSAMLVSTPLISARDNETDDSLRTRFYQFVQQAAYGGNIADYEEKTLAIDGVGAVEVFPAHLMGTAGAVGVVIGNTAGRTTSTDLVNTVQMLMGTDGSGIAPIGHTVTVKTSSDLTITVAAQIKIKTGSSFLAIQPVVVQAITSYINAVGFKDPTIFYAKLQAAILDSHPDIMDIGTVTINGVSTNLALSKTFASYQVPAIGTITVSQVT